MLMFAQTTANIIKRAKIQKKIHCTKQNHILVINTRKFPKLLADSKQFLYLCKLK